MKRVSVVRSRILIVTAVAAALVVALAGFYFYRQYRLRLLIAHWRVDGLAADKSGDYPRAVQDLTGYLDKFPEDQDALAAFIDARGRVPTDGYAEISQSIVALRNLIHLNPNAIDRRVELLKLYATAGAQTEAIDTATEILDRDPANDTASDIKSQAQINLKQYKEALATSQAWMKADPASLQAGIRVIALEGQLSTPADQISQEIDNWALQHPDQVVRVQYYHGIAYAVTGDLAHCRTVLLACAAQNPKDDDLDQALVSELSVCGKDGEDVKVLDQLVQAGAGAKCRQMLVRRRWEMGQPTSAIDSASGLNLADDSVSSDVLAILALSNQTVGKPSNSGPIKASLSARADPVSVAWSLIIGTPISADWKAYRAVVDQTRKALAASPTNGYMAFYLGNALAQIGEQQLALEAWRRAAGECPTWGLPRSRMAEILAGQGDLAAAAQTASEGLRLTPTAAAGLVLGRVALALDESGIQTNRDQAATLIDELTKIVPGSEQLTELRVQFLCRTGQTKSAQDLISQTLTASPPPSESLLLNLANTSRASGLGLENQLLDTDQKLHGLTPDVALTRALADFANNGLTSAAVLFDHMRSSVGDSASLAWEFARAQFLLSAGSPDAKAAWVDLATHHPDDLTVQLQVIQSGSLTSDRADSLAVIDRLRKMLGDDSVYCDMAKARVLVATRSGDADDREITELFRKLIATHPNMVEPRELWAMVLERQGHIDEAINQLQLAEKIEPTSVNIGLSLASLQQSKGDNEAARQQLAMVEKLTTANAAQLDREARLRQSLGDAAGAIGSLKNLSTRTTDQDLLLADLYCQNHQIPEAGDIVTRLMAAPSPEVLQYAIRFFAATGKDSLAQSALEQLRATKIPATDMVLTEAAYDIASNKHDQAVALLADATSKYPHEPRAWQLRVMTLFNSTHPADAIPVIDQGLAAIPGDPSLLALKDSAADVVVAMTVSQIDKIARDYVQSPINQPADLDVIRSVAQATRSTDPEAYLNLSRALSQRYPGIEGVQLWTVQTYLKARRMRDAAAAASRVLQTFATSPDAAALATAVFSGQQSWSDALDAARKWKALSPGGGVPDVAVARALIHLKRPQEAISQLQPYIEQAKANPDAQGQVLLTYAEALVDTSAVSQAADLILPLGPQTPAWRHDCLTFVAQHLGGADAQQWLTKIAGEVDQTSTDELATVAEAWEAISSRSGADRTQCLKNAEGIFQTIEAASSPTSSALTRDGMYRERAQQLDLAVTMYRRALKTDPNNALAKNNLAMLLIARPPDVREALALAKSLVQTSPAEPEFLDTLASVQLQAGDVDSAVNDLRQACTLAPEELRLQIRLARVLIDHQRKAEAGIVLATIDNSGLDLKALPTDQQHDLARLRSDLSTAPATQGSNL